MALSSRRRLSLWFGLTAILGIVLGILTLAFFSAGAIYDYEDTVQGEDLPDVDVIVCLAGGKGRISLAAETWYLYWQKLEKLEEIPTEPLHVPVLYLSGVGHHADWGVASKQIRPEVLKTLEKIDKKNLIVENFSDNTDENAQWLAKAVHDHSWKRILLITSSYHMRRAKLILERTLRKEGDIDIETLSVVQEPFRAGHWHRDWQGLQVTLWEFFKWVAYRFVWEPKE